MRVTRTINDFQEGLHKELDNIYKAIETLSVKSRQQIGYKKVERE